MKVVYWPQRTMTVAERGELAAAGKSIEGVVVPLQGCSDPGQWLVAPVEDLKSMGYQTSDMVSQTLMVVGCRRVWVQLWAASNSPRTQLIDQSGRDLQRRIAQLKSVGPYPKWDWDWLLDCELYPYSPPNAPGVTSLDAWDARPPNHDPYPFVERQSVYCWMRDMAPMVIAGSDRNRTLREGFARYLRRGGLTPPRQNAPALAFTLDTCEADDPGLRFQKRHLKGSRLKPCPGVYAGTAPTAKSLTASLRRLQGYGAQYAYIYDCENALCTTAGAQVLLAAVRAVA